jgi:hypothetical protein
MCTLRQSAPQRTVGVIKVQSLFTTKINVVRPHSLQNV